ncbi:6-phosphogluconate dehydrogenase C-terminal domain-like protein [Hypoxylon fragiforme]|uniref:6-phosphogluconate dehydrogenase C-terminal domain-like protein n=1 Tax=Hypoxylon fragiforme TaxID=63214 RepID=UPI0020C5DDAF|nr:6-phosphogluconate dehydrogenase C-terminal domain-like protein [Hypoxylon fragiforme]KAI2612764.1 6-phosphogluconate dehydrogenase C-terminal domain-like protein [Hypoxylon fragiforme]
MPKILIFGTGSLGACYAWVLANAVGEHNVTAICRSNYDAVARDGFTIHSGLWGENLRFRPRVARSVEEAVLQLQQHQQQSDDNDGLFDYVLVASKALPTVPSTASLIAPAVTPGQTTVVLIQNGIGIEDEYARAFPANPLLSTVAYLPATQVRPGVVRHTEVELLHVGAYPATGGEGEGEGRRAANAFAALLAQGGATAQVHADVQRERWVKLLVNAAWNPVCALTRLRDREFLTASERLRLGPEQQEEGGDGFRFIRDVMLEIASVARAHGYADVGEELVLFQLRRAAARGLPGIQPSMQADALAGRRLEVDAIVGNAVRLAGKKGVPVPMLRTVHLLANGLSESLSRGKEMS